MYENASKEFEAQDEFNSGEHGGGGRERKIGEDMIFSFFS